MLTTKLKTRLTAVAALIIVATAALCSCGGRTAAPTAAADSLTQEQLDSIAFGREHHYTTNYNFIVKADSLRLVRQQPEETMGGLATDTVTVYRHDHIAVADIRIMPADREDTVWVQVARDQSTFGWTHEGTLLDACVPADPISQFISTFSDTHLLVSLIVISVIAVAYLLRTIFRRNAKIVHFNDIPTFYPTLLALTVAACATLYASIQTFAPEAWEHFYFHPTLNPFIVSPILSVFLVSVWAMFIIGLATADVVRGMLPRGEALLYMCGLACVCAVNYIVFSLTTLYYVGYALFAAYAVYALRTYMRRFRRAYACGRCGAPMRHKGRCPACGAMNE